MHFNNRFVRLAAALGIAGLVMMQVPMRSGIAQAADGYPDSNNGLLSNKTVVLGAVLIGAGGALATSGGAAAAAAAAGGAAAGGAAGKGTSIYDLTSQKPEQFDQIARILRNAGKEDTYRQGEKITVFWPTNEALVKTLGAARVKALQETAYQDQARAFLASITVKGAYNLAALKAAAASNKTLETLAGNTIEVSVQGDKILINGVEVLGTEFPASNGWVLATNGVIASE